MAEAAFGFGPGRCSLTLLGHHSYATHVQKQEVPDTLVFPPSLWAKVSGVLLGKSTAILLPSKYVKAFSISYFYYKIAMANPFIDVLHYTLHKLSLTNGGLPPVDMVTN